MFREGQRADGFRIGMKVKACLVARAEVQARRLGLPWPGGQVDPPVSAPGREGLEFRENETGKAASAVRGVRPDPLELGRVRPVSAPPPATDAPHPGLRI